MRLLNTGSFEVEEFHGEKIPEYAILSHTWDDHEMTFPDVTQKHASNLSAHPGFIKIEKACILAKKEGFDHIWIDTCCIDKSSSTELSEAIKSMYRWYREAQVCLTYLSDVPSDEDPEPLSSAFAMSRWFRRGWTLQELIAPPVVEFYARDWVEVGTKLSLQATIVDTTGIPQNVLMTGVVSDYSVAQRMHWASRRYTTRDEDEAYCLLGLFDVNMPMLYGEGKRAFLRLQEEILKISNDQSLFAWKAEKDAVRKWTRQGLLADSPRDFVGSDQIIPFKSSFNMASYQMTNLGLCIELPLITSSDGRFHAILNCKVESEENLLGVVLKPINEDDERLARCETRRLVHVNPAIALETPRKSVYVIRNGEDPQQARTSEYIFCRIYWLVEPVEGYGYHISQVCPGPKGGADVEIKARRSNAVLAALMLANDKASQRFVVVVGRFGGQPWCDIVTDINNRDLETIKNTHSFYGRSDRASATVQESFRVSVAIKKRGKRLEAVKSQDVGLYSLYITVRKTG